MNGFWDKSIDAKCTVNVTYFFYGQSIPNILTDVALLVLPIRFVWRLQARRYQKILLVGTLMTGGLYVPVSWNIGLELIECQCDCHFNCEIYLSRPFRFRVSGRDLELRERADLDNTGDEYRNRVR